MRTMSTLSTIYELLTHRLKQKTLIIMQDRFFVWHVWEKGVVVNLFVFYIYISFTNSELYTLYSKDSHWFPQDAIVITEKSAGI